MKLNLTKCSLLVRRLMLVVPICMAVFVIEHSAMMRVGQHESSLTIPTELVMAPPKRALRQPAPLGVSRTFRTSSRRCNMDDSKIAKSDFKSMSGEDLHLMNKFFKGLCNGTYVEIGGLDGVTISNSYVFNKELGWKGVLVEGNLRLAGKLKQKRPNELLTLHSAVCAISQTVHYVLSHATGGIYEFASPKFRQKYWANVKLEDATPMPCQPLRQILKKHVPTHKFFDFWSLDVEGAELEVLRSVDFTEVAFGVIFVEIGEQDQPIKAMSIRMFLLQKGYTYLEEMGRSSWFVNNDFANIYSKVVDQF